MFYFRGVKGRVKIILMSLFLLEFRVFVDFGSFLIVKIGCVLELGRIVSFGEL